jgi:hypothetical protein
MITLPKNPDRVQLYSFIISFGLLITIIGSIFGWYILGIFFEIIVPVSYSLLCWSRSNLFDEILHFRCIQYGIV